jgi:hypothetical protein
VQVVFCKRRIFAKDNDDTDDSREYHDEDHFSDAGDDVCGWNGSDDDDDVSKGRKHGGRIPHLVDVVDISTATTPVSSYTITLSLHNGAEYTRCWIIPSTREFDGPSRFYGRHSQRQRYDEVSTNVGTHGECVRTGWDETHQCLLLWARIYHLSEP